MVDTKDLYVGIIVQVTQKHFTGQTFSDFTVNYNAITIEEKPRLFFYSANRKFIDIITGNVYKKYGVNLHKVDDIVVDIKCPIIAINRNIPTKLKKKKAYELAVKMAGIELVGEDKPRLRKVFKKGY